MMMVMIMMMIVVTTRTATVVTAGSLNHTWRLHCSSFFWGFII